MSKKAKPKKIVEPAPINIDVDPAAPDIYIDGIIKTLIGTTVCKLMLFKVVDVHESGPHQVHESNLVMPMTTLLEYVRNIRRVLVTLDPGVLGSDPQIKQYIDELKAPIH